MQKYTSKLTSINSKKVPLLFKAVPDDCWGQLNFDLGGGKYDTATEYLKQFGCKNLIYDPYNRTEEWNREIIDRLVGNRVDTATLSNVLNVILEKENRIKVLKSCYNRLKDNGVLFIGVYEGNRTGVVSIYKERNSCQLNCKLRCYLEEVLEVFKTAVIKNHNGKSLIWAFK